MIHYINKNFKFIEKLLLETICLFLISLNRNYAPLELNDFNIMYLSVSLFILQTFNHIFINNNL